MKTLKNVLITALAVVVVVFLFRLAWTLAGLLLKLVVAACILVVLAGLIVYLYNQYNNR